jgi:hypothetical protein
MGAKHRKLCTALLLISAGIVASAAAMAGDNSDVAPLIIQEQGSFAVGGTAVTVPGTFDPSNRVRTTPPEPIPRGRRCTATTLMCSTRSR